MDKLERAAFLIKNGDRLKKEIIDTYKGKNPNLQEVAEAALLYLEIDLLKAVTADTLPGLNVSERP